MQTNVQIQNQFQKWIDDPQTRLPLILGRVLTAIPEDLGQLQVIHPTTNDPVLVSDKLGSIAIWFKF
jgi:hypothetical protein